MSTANSPLHLASLSGRGREKRMSMLPFMLYEWGGMGPACLHSAPCTRWLGWAGRSVHHVFRTQSSPAPINCSRRGKQDTKSPPLTALRHSSPGASISMGRRFELFGAPRGPSRRYFIIDGPASPNRSARPPPAAARPWHRAHTKGVIFIGVSSHSMPSPFPLSG